MNREVCSFWRMMCNSPATYEMCRSHSSQLAVCLFQFQSLFCSSHESCRSLYPIGSRKSFQNFYQVCPRSRGFAPTSTICTKNMLRRSRIGSDRKQQSVGPIRSSKMVLCAVSKCAHVLENPSQNASHGRRHTIGVNLCLCVHSKDTKANSLHETNHLISHRDFFSCINVKHI